MLIDVYKFIFSIEPIKQAAAAKNKKKLYFACYFVHYIQVLVARETTFQKFTNRKYYVQSFLISFNSLYSIYYFQFN